MKKKVTPGTPNLLRLVNRNTILLLLEEKEETSRSELSTLSGLSLPTVSTVVKELLLEGWLVEAGDGISQGGKPPQLIKLDPDARYIGAIQMNQGIVKMRVTNLIGKIYTEDTFYTDEINANRLCVVTCSKFSKLVDKYQRMRELLLGVGVSVPGVVNEKGEVSNAPEFEWDQEPIQTYFSNELPYRIIVENDVRMAVLGEAWRVKNFTDTMIYIHLSKGIGAGILIDGKLYKGTHFSAGEIGNMIVSPKTVTGTRKNGQGFFESHFGQGALENGETNEKKFLQNLSFVLVNLISTIDPKMIVFGGEITLTIQDFLAKLNGILFNLLNRLPQMYITPHGNNAPLYGAPKVILENHRKQVTWTSL